MLFHLLVLVAGCGHAVPVPPPVVEAEAQAAPAEAAPPPCESFDSLVALCARVEIPVEGCEPEEMGPAGGIGEVVRVTYVEEDEEDGITSSASAVGLRIATRWYIGASSTGYDMGGTDRESGDLSVEPAEGGLILTQHTSSSGDGAYSAGSSHFTLIQGANGAPYVRFAAVTRSDREDPYSCQDVDLDACDECADRCPSAKASSKPDDPAMSFLPNDEDSACVAACRAPCICYTGAEYELPLEWEGPDRLRVGPSRTTGDPNAVEEWGLPNHSEASVVDLPNCEAGGCEAHCPLGGAGG